MATDPLATKAQLAEAWRPLTSTEQTRADYWLAAASREVRRRWPDVDDRLAAGDLKELDVSDVVISLVLPIMQTVDNDGARSWSVASGTEQRSVNMGSGGSGERFDFEDWMLEVFLRQAAPLPAGAFPLPICYDHLFESKERYL
ncbi:hypothetical protein [Zhihengliuella halotolerans]|uniref:Gp19/Gp15/Gp42-like protein n=1 Tax=Zhihengliuella halotolerans TaxID=370736 RepID=A0A4Q8ACE7_9MICC|nr:hypothetical protein [Zhihengliuella halotolerans]RZU61744.1 Gp19/Gp15/Gp42-like protein [Zhihengliuella halotolerans]